MTDTDELFITVTITIEANADEGEPAREIQQRYAYAAGFGEDAIVLSPHWDEAKSVTRPHGDYWMLFRRD